MLCQSKSVILKVRRVKQSKKQTNKAISILACLVCDKFLHILYNMNIMDEYNVHTKIQLNPPPPRHKFNLQFWLVTIGCGTTVVIDVAPKLVMVIDGVVILDVATQTP